MKAFSIRQPWAWLVVHGYKTIENKPKSITMRGRFLIQAPLHRPTKDDIEDAKDLLKEMGADANLLPETFDLGGIVGSVEVVDCISRRRDLKNKQDNVWYEPVGGYVHGYVLRNPVTLPFRRYKGQLGYFNVELTQEEDRILSVLPAFVPTQPEESVTDAAPAQTTLAQIGEGVRSQVNNC